ncbi:MAG: hypothetical protein KGZ83_07165, partial [Sulfuricella sp.]|nr:hypothetical protein [Sulfuricella sp.]
PRLKGADARGIGLPDVGSETTLPNDRRNILRRGTGEGYAEVDFIGNDGVGYRSRWSVKRAHGKAERKLQNAEMTIIRIADQQPVGGHLKSEVVKTIIEKIGLSFEQFTRAVLLAQNEFFTFLKAGDDERAALLQTLTGTDRFEVLSKRAYERHKAEQDKLQQLRNRVADQQPLAEEHRLRLESEQTAAKSAIQAQGEQEQWLAGTLRWYQELEKALQREAAAQAELAQATARREAALPRRDRFALIEAVQDARPLLAESQRLGAAGEEIAGQVSAAEGNLATTAHACTVAQTAAAAANAALGQLESARREFAPLISQARQLDIEVATRLEAHASADKVQQRASAALAKANGDLDLNRKAIQAAQGQLQAATEWLNGHAHLQALGDGWLRWDGLFASAGEEQQRIVQADEELQRLNSQSHRQTLAVGEGETRLAAACDEMQTAEEGLRNATATLQHDDGEALARARVDLEQRKEALQQADQAWRERSAGETQGQALDQEAQEVSRKVAAAQARLEQVRSQQPIALASAQQAERGWRVVFDAAQESVGALREQLQADVPCPVCGALEHPYVAQNPALDNALARLADGLKRCRNVVTELEIEEKTQFIQLETLGGRHAQIESQRARQQHEQEKLLAVWSQAAARLSELFGAEAAAFPDWLVGQFDLLQQEAMHLAEQESQQRRATMARQQAQERLNRVRQAHDALKDEVAQRKADAERIHSAIQSAHERQSGARQRQAQALEQLDQAHIADNGWRGEWAADPQRYRSACRRDAETWSAQKKSEAALLAEMASLDLAGHGLSRQASEAEEARRQAAQALTAAAGQLHECQSARRELFAGLELPAHPVGTQPPSLVDLDVQRIDSHLNAALDAARSHQESTRHTLKEREQQLAVQQATLTQLSKQFEDNQAAAQQAAANLAQWLTAFNARAPESAPLDGASLPTLLAHDAAWLSAERQALAHLDTAIAAATGGLAQMRSQRETHENTRPTADAPEIVQAKLEQVAAALHGLRESLSGVELALRRDDEIRQKAAELLDTLAAQEKTARLWAQMNELIGAADGKKFRNYAQQLTLDILLGYANAHLKDLARRYRLSRVRDSLALLVIDQDMGDEQRSVHSLSGGESFLVSLALALGLASLSSHRVRVESLFIDEGFGSLDADTLRVAMDALDSLQSLGRKVGVISHVQEMTERIGTCVQVKRLPGGQSQVVVAGV